MTNSIAPRPKPLFKGAPAKRQRAAPSHQSDPYPENTSFQTLSFGKKILPQLEKIHYALSNEKGQELVQSLTQAQTSDLHLGFACWLNFDIIAKTNVPRAIICDIDTDMIALFNTLRSCVIEANTIDEFIDLFWNQLEKTKDFVGLPGIDYEFVDNKEKFAKKVKSIGWLSDETQFKYIKSLYSEGKIIHRNVDITDKDAFKQLAQWKNDQNANFHTVYTSNIPEWLYQSNGGLKKLETNMREILDTHTTVLTAFKDTANHELGPTLHKETGRHPQLPYARH